MSEFLDPSKELFYDGILTIICDDGVEFKIISGEFDSPMSLEQIQLDYPNVMMVIYEEPLRGYVFRFGNHKVGGKKMWEKTGITNGFA